jgi:hypothetical protein
MKIKQIATITRQHDGSFICGINLEYFLRKTIATINEMRGASGKNPRPKNQIPIIPKGRSGKNIIE